MDGLLWFGAVAAGFRGAGLLLLLLNRRHLARLAAAPAPAAAGAPPKISVIIPARDEAANLEATLRALLVQGDPALEIVVIDDRSTDATGEVARRVAGEADGRIVVIAGTAAEPGWLGKPWAQRQGVARAGGELLLFIDADVILAPGALRWARERMAALRADALGLLPEFRRPGFWDEVLQSMLPLITLCELPLFYLNSDRQKTRWVSAGAFLLVRREVYERAGGHGAVRDRVIEDIGLSGVLKRAGARCRMLDGRAFVALTMYRGRREYIAGFRKNFASMFDHPAILLGGIAVYLACNLVQPLWAAALAFAALRGAPVTPGMFAMFLGAAALLAVRAALAFTIGQNPLYALTHPLQAAVNGWTFALSCWDRFVRRKITWRGRDIDAATVRSP